MSKNQPAKNPPAKPAPTTNAAPVPVPVSDTPKKSRKGRAKQNWKRRNASLIRSIRDGYLAVPGLAPADAENFAECVEEMLSHILAVNDAYDYRVKAQRKSAEMGMDVKAAKDPDGMVEMTFGDTWNTDTYSVIKVSKKFIGVKRLSDNRVMTGPRSWFSVVG